MSSCTLQQRFGGLKMLTIQKIGKHAGTFCCQLFRFRIGSIHDVQYDELVEKEDNRPIHNCVAPDFWNR